MISVHWQRIPLTFSYHSPLHLQRLVEKGGGEKDKAWKLQLSLVVVKTSCIFLDICQLWAESSWCEMKGFWQPINTGNLTE